MLLRVHAAAIVGADDGFVAIILSEYFYCCM
ncbi:hypothetical protein MARPU_13050 [Marichromatium purpuratum 984]|uniref:Uncharacterized protein n=1 Tax=Marichromatium purpuratum 984 TaxID=765910 RepID=W0E958_MARPU|nr:hypothetical protein MARPU_13050 [Marichromatium purpuratum 984]